MPNTARLSYSFFAFAVVVLSVPVTAQSSSEPADLLREALSVAATHYESIGIARARPFLVDTIASSAALRRVGFANSEVLSALSSLPRNARGADISSAIVCTLAVSLRTCRVVDDAVFLTVDSATTSASSAEVFVRYRYTAQRGPKGEWSYVPFVQLRVDFTRQPSGWRVVRNTVTLRS
jgi:hypothetical protein